ncbi:hypothetical protein CIHG_10255 [Coccidioides immitis H538.4]|uniref:Uncharacterized protein n=1 Tax=Coccidioides immitis H538.4 TaxID=396776 RepID=A0A0J8S4R6_COCIT|nr:hypothetical protein CIHG_10255 [Coccidioides immitis H538.4]
MPIYYFDQTQQFSLQNYQFIMKLSISMKETTPPSTSLVGSYIHMLESHCRALELALNHAATDFEEKEGHEVDKTVHDLLNVKYSTLWKPTNEIILYPSTHGQIVRA